jgi:putative SOS response-associated peptidase YedK
MCGRYYSRRQKQQIAEQFHAGKVFEEPIAPNYNIAPTTFQPIIRIERDSGEREMALLRWGLVPFFAKSLSDFKGFSTFNARSETIAKSATWRGPFKKRRCLVPADGFYEWKTTLQASDATAALFLGEDAAVNAELPRAGKPAAKKQTPKANKTPFAITLASGEPMAFAGLWDAWHDKATDVWLQSFAIVTTEANEIMAPIHTRMPVILAQRDWAEWLDRDDSRPAPAHLLRPFDSDAMRTDGCNPAVGNVRNNGPEMLQRPLNSA